MSSASILNMLTPSDVQGLSPATLLQLEKLATEKVTPTTVAFVPVPLLVYFAILYFSAKGTEFLMSRFSGAYRRMSSVHQRTSVIYVLNIFYTTLALVLQLVASPSLAQEYTATRADCVRVASVVVAGLYLFELVYRDQMRWPMLAHHFATLFAVVFVNVALDKTWHPSVIVTGLCWLFQATTEQSIFAALLMYRLQCRPSALIKALRFAAIQSFIPKFVFALYLLVWWGKKQEKDHSSSMDVAFSCVLFASITVLMLTQVYGSWVVWKIAGSVARRAGEARSAESLESGVVQAQAQTQAQMQTLEKERDMDEDRDRVGEEDERRRAGFDGRAGSMAMVMDMDMVPTVLARPSIGQKAYSAASSVSASGSDDTKY